MTEEPKPGEVIQPIDPDDLPLPDTEPVPVDDETWTGDKEEPA